MEAKIKKMKERVEMLKELLDETAKELEELGKQQVEPDKELVHKRIEKGKKDFINEYMAEIGKLSKKLKDLGEPEFQVKKGRAKKQKDEK